MDLLGQLTGRRHNQRPDLAGLALGQMLQDGQHERGRLARARLGQAHDIFSGQNMGNRLLLDGGGGAKTGGRDGRVYARIEVKLTKFHKMLLGLVTHGAKSHSQPCKF